MKSHGIVRPTPAFLRRDLVTHEGFMKLAIEEAKQGSGKTSPNPTVGAVLVKDGRLLAKGYHHAAGMPHAEIEAISKLIPDFHLRPGTYGLQPRPLAGCTLYVTLEPCSSHGRTPPCTEAIIVAGISRVVYGTTDPDPRHRGRASKILEKAGIEVIEGVLAPECAALNTHWNHRISTGLPWIIAKAGMSLDGRLDSPPNRRWITSPASRREAMHLRATVEAILVGGETIRTDDPSLTIRGIRLPKDHPQPWRVVWSRSGNLSKKATVFTDKHKDRTLVFTGRSLKNTLAELAQRGISSVLLEGGGQTLGEAFDQNLVDEIRFFIAPIIQGGQVPTVGGLGAASNESAIRLKDVSCTAIGSDVLVKALVRKESGTIRQHRRVKN
jgi:diaminohydroxyphosphoribosylaminopyrimidine deaminase/5-amino-6-(5-phosphoribosylamino)uracil reductase